MNRRRRVALAVLFPLVLALMAYIVIQYVQVVYAVLWPGLANGTTISLRGIGSTVWGYYAGFGKMVIDVSPPSMPVYVAVLPYYTLASASNLSDINTATSTDHGTYYPCGPYGLIVSGGVVIPVAVQRYQGVYVYVPTDARNVPTSCYSNWYNSIAGLPILTFDGTPHVNIAGTVYVKAYYYDPSTGLISSTYPLYSMSQTVPRTSGTAYGDYGDTNVDGVWYLQMVAVYVTKIRGQAIITLYATA